MSAILELEGCPNMKLTAEHIARRLVAPGAPYEVRKHFVCVPNLSYGLLGWEADLIACTKSGYLTEIEIKISASDWHADKKKAKWKTGYPNSTGRIWGWHLIKQFYYAAPMGLAARWQEFDIPEFAGVYGIQEPTDRYDIGIHILKPPAIREGHRKLTDKEMLLLARLSAMRIWTMPGAHGFTTEAENITNA
jgi:hypothetical protein